MSSLQKREVNEVELRSESLFRRLTLILLNVYLLHTLAVPVIALWLICTDFPEFGTAAQLLGFFPAVLFLVLNAMMTELPGRFSKALLLVTLVPVDVGIGIWLMGSEPGFFFIELFFVDIIAMGVAFLLMTAIQLKDKRGPLICGGLMFGMSLLAFGGPVAQVYGQEDRLWSLFLLCMIAVEAWVYMHILGNKTLPFRPLESTSEKPRLLDRLLPDRFAPVSWGISDVVATPVVIGGLLVWFFLPMFLRP